MLKHDKIYRFVSSVLVVLFVVSALMAVLAFTAPQPALAKGGGITPLWTQCWSLGCTNTVCDTQCNNHSFYVYKIKEWLCYSDGAGWYEIETCSCKEYVGDC